MAENKKKDRINYSYLNKRVTIFETIPGECLLFLIPALFFIFQSMIISLIVVCVLFPIIIITAYKNGATTIRFIIDNYKFLISNKIKTIKREKIE